MGSGRWSVPTTVRSAGRHNVDVSGGETSRLRNLRLFLASPGGLDDEREALFTLAEELNLSLRRIDWQIEVLGWENRGPAGGRAQADINEDVDRAHVFCGVLGNRWGTPTGEATSGFAEEWDRSLARFRQSGRPHLWLFFKDVPSDQLADPGEQLRAVLGFRERVEREESAFHVSFLDPTELVRKVRRSLLDLVIQRAGIGAAAKLPELDWRAALVGEPASFLAEGPERERLAEESKERDPEQAARLFLELAEELEGLGFGEAADGYRRRGASALSAAGQIEDAMAHWRGVLRRALSHSHPIEAGFAARQLGEELPPERRWEARAWAACANWAEDDEGARDDLTAALRQTDGANVDQETTDRWRETLWHVRLDRGEAGAVVTEAETDAPTSEELEMLNAEARAQVDPEGYRAHWQPLRERSSAHASEAPAAAAQIAARWAFELAGRGEIDEAREEYARAAGLWGKVDGGQEEAAECFFSAQSAASLGGEIFPGGWGWRPLAASMRGGGDSFAAQAADYERSGLSAQLGRGPYGARPELRRAIRLRRQGGHLRGWLAAQGALGDCERAAEESMAAALAYCACGDDRRAGEAAGERPCEELCDRLPIGNTEWATRASLSVLAKVGRWASEDRATALLPEILSRTRGEGGYGGDLREAVAALASISFALPDSELKVAVEHMEDMLGNGNTLASKAAGSGLWLLGESGRVDPSARLITDFAADPRSSAVGPQWIAEHLDLPEAVASVRAAALAGELIALDALIRAGSVAGDEELEQVCERYCQRIIAADLGRDEDGCIRGLMDLRTTGEVASAAPSRESREQVAEKLLLYALEDCWPVVNRAAALHGLRPLAKSLEPDSFVERIRPLLATDTDAFEEASRRGGEMFSEPGEVESAALYAAAELSPENPPGWLVHAVVAARVDRRRMMRSAAWECAGISSPLPIDGLELALFDPAVKVRAAALFCWQDRGDGLPASRALERLAEDDFTEVRVALIRLLALDRSSVPDAAQSRLLDDPDAWVRHLALHELGPPRHLPSSDDVAARAGLSDRT